MRQYVNLIIDDVNYSAILKILRLWVTRCDPEAEATIMSLRYKDFKPLNEEDSMSSIFGVANHYIFQGRVRGKIISVETVDCNSVDQWCYDPEETFVGFGKMQEDKRPKNKVSILRVFYDADRDANEEIGFRDFLPQNFGAQTVDNSGYERYSSLVERASKWLNENSEVIYCGAQTLDAAMSGNKSSSLTF